MIELKLIPDELKNIQGNFLLVNKDNNINVYIDIVNISIAQFMDLKIALNKLLATTNN